ncbi:MAG: Smr/MutS family protein [Vampirovibrionales bacterium]|nr:Smr/MutS family protein [Vampirovibrionales bacterium]
MTTEDNLNRKRLIDDSLATLEWQALFDELLSQCETPYGVLSWQETPFLETAQNALGHSQAVEQIKRFLLKFGDPLSHGKIHLLTSQLQRLQKGGTLTLEELSRFHETLVSAHAFQAHFLCRAEGFSIQELSVFKSALPYLADPLSVHDLLDRLGQYLDADHQLKQTASKRYGELIKNIRSERQAILQRLNNTLSDTSLAPIFQNPTVSERDGRYVLPVKIEQRSQLPGIVHASSSSGSTLFIEPQGIVELNNRIQSFESELQAEIEKILEEISRFLEMETEHLWQWLVQIGQLDRHLAAARLSRLLQAEPISYKEKPGLVFYGAKHPLLLLKTLKNPSASSSVIPNDVTLGDEAQTPERINTLVITGPNTGGKTVVLKLVGLLCLMAKAGLHLPVKEGSSVFFFEHVFADIGDQQSLAQSLSTFSAHMGKIKTLLSDETDLSKSLVLIDEIAAGTDPAEGAALAKAILETLYDKNAITVVTTHLGELKVEAHQHPGYLNASVEFSTETLSPTYRLLLGVPGTSNAITIAQKLGIEDAVTRKARAYLAAPVRDAGDLIASLELKNQRMHQALAEAEAARAEAKADADTIAAEKTYLESEKRRILQQYQSQLKSRVHDLDAELKQLRKSIRDESQNLEVLGALGQDVKALGQVADEVFLQSATQIEPAETVAMADLSMGQMIFSKRLGLSGNIIAKSDTGKDVIIQSGLMRLTVPLEDIQLNASKRKQKKSFRETYIKRQREPEAASGHYPLLEGKALRQELDVRGTHAEEALRQLAQFLDEATLQGLSQVGVIHGLGSGVLKKEIRQYLQKAPYVSRFHPAEALDGGDGKTVVHLKD